ncbi:MAG: ABC transporter permease [Candidatus Ratteibacteria bacterium]|nr:ABC transporter permease [Candidatus Ratteibacteria bacterium]
MFAHFLYFLGRYCFKAVNHAGRLFMLFFDTLYWMVTPPYERKNISDQMVKIGIKSLPVVLITGAFTGMVLVVQTYYQFRRLSVESGIGAVVGFSMTRELGPVLTALILAGRVGAAITAELGTMKVTEQIDALESLAVSPIKYLVVPRFIACMTLLPILTVFSDFMGIIGGYFVGVKMMGVHGAFFLNNLKFVNPSDIINGLIKASVFGMIIAIVSCYRGFITTGGAEGVGRSTTISVVASCMLILVSDFFLSVALF